MLLLADLSWPSFKVQFNICQTGVARNFRPAMTLGSSLLPGCSPRRRTLARSSANGDFSVTPAMTQDARPFAFRTAAPHAVTDAVFKSVFQTFLRYRTFGTDVLSFRHAHSVAREEDGPGTLSALPTIHPLRIHRVVPLSTRLDAVRSSSLQLSVTCLACLATSKSRVWPTQVHSASANHLPPSHCHHLLIEDTPRRL